MMMFRPRRRDRRPRPRRKEEEEEEEEPKARLDFFVSPLPDLEDIFTDANDDERFLRERRRTEGILFRLNRRLGWICLFLSLFLLLAKERERQRLMTNVFKNLPRKEREKELA
jgi:hypothetical protein